MTNRVGEKHGLPGDIEVNGFLRSLGKHENGAGFQINQFTDRKRAAGQAEIREEPAIEQTFAHSPAEFAGRQALGEGPLRGQPPKESIRDHRRKDHRQASRGVRYACFKTETKNLALWNHGVLYLHAALALFKLEIQFENEGPGAAQILHDQPDNSTAFRRIFSESRPAPSSEISMLTCPPS